MSLKTDLKFNKLLEKIHNAKERLIKKQPITFTILNEIDERVKALFQIYKNSNE